MNFGSKPIEPPPLDDTGKPSGGPLNRRAEMWLNMRNALQEGRFSIPDDDSLHADLTSCGYKYDSSGQLVLESKQDMRKRGMPSPDSADAMALYLQRAGRLSDSAQHRAQLQSRDRLPKNGHCLMIKMVTVQIRECIEGDAGEVVRGFYSVTEEILRMCDEDGRPTGKPLKLQPGDDPGVGAARLLRQKCLRRQSRILTAGSSIRKLEWPDVSPTETRSRPACNS